MRIQVDIKERVKISTSCIEIRGAYKAACPDCGAKHILLDDDFKMEIPPITYAVIKCKSCNSYFAVD